nr:MAG TPA: hypothetical protein [Bacteriophage sp.]
MRCKYKITGITIFIFKIVIPVILFGDVFVPQRCDTYATFWGLMYLYRPC